MGERVIPATRVFEWAHAFESAIEKIVQDKYPEEAHRWPLLRAFDAEGYVLRDSHLAVILRDKLSGIPAMGDAEALEDPAAPSEVPSLGSLDPWLTYLKRKLSARPADALVIVPLVDTDEQPHVQFKKWPDSNKAMWKRQVILALTAHHYLLKGLDVSGEFFIPPGYQHLADGCQRFLKDHPSYQENVFIMTRMPSGNRLLESLDAELRAILREHGLDPVRADDKMYLEDRNLWNNVCVCMICCKHGIAILEDRIKDEFNPNVALEYGFMRALNRPTLLLKDVAFRNLRADIMGTLWEEFDITDIGGSVRAPVEKWLGELERVQ